MAITEELNQILNATYGSEVRQSIHDAIKQTYDDASANGNANMEVSLARGSFPVLNDRLNKSDEEINKINSQLAHKAEQNFAEATSKRVDELIIGSGDANAEVTDAHVSSAKNKTFTTLSNRINESEEETLALLSSNSKIKNAVVSPMFSDVTKWTVQSANMSVANGVATVTASGTDNLTRVLQVLPVRPVQGEKYYAGFKVKITSGTPTALRIIVRDWTGTATFQKGLFVTNPFVDVEYDIDKIIQTSNFQGDARIYIDVEFSEAQGTYEIRQPMVMNLSKAYGPANVPTIHEFRGDLDRLGGFVEDTGYLTEPAEMNRVLETSTKTTARQEATATIKTGKATSPSRVLWTITYDDESENIYKHAYPVHQSENVPLTFYIIPNRIQTEATFDWGKAMTWKHLNEMNSSGLMEIGHHTMGHVYTPGLTEVEFRDNIEKGLDIFAKHGYYPKHFAFPGGSNNAMNRNVVREYFASAATTRFDANDPESYDMHPLAIDRRASDSWFVNFQDDLDKFIANGSGWLITYMHAVHPDGHVIGSTGDRTCWTPTQLQDMIQYAKSKGVEIVTMDEGLRTYGPFEYFYTEDVEPVYVVQKNGVVVNNVQ